MSWTYSGNPTSSTLDTARFIIGDTNSVEPVMQDEEIQFIIAEYGTNDNLLRHKLFTHAATIFAREIKRSLGPQSEDPTARLKFFTEQAALYKAKLSTAGISLPAYAHPKTFRRGMQNNPPWPAPAGDDSNV